MSDSKNNKKKWHPTKHCELCGAMIDKKAKVCRQCYDIKRRKNVPTQNELMDCLSELKGNFCAVGRRYGVSDNAVRKWCRSYGMSCTSFTYRR